MRLKTSKQKKSLASQKKVEHTYSEEEYNHFFKKYKKWFIPECFVQLHGGLGAGKSTFVKYFLENISKPSPYLGSPSFPLMNQYEVNGLSVIHIDFYRILTLEECEDAGLIEAMLPEKNKIIFCEWLHKFPSLQKEMNQVARKKKIPFVEIEFNFPLEVRTDKNQRILSGSFRR